MTIRSLLLHNTIIVLVVLTVLLTVTGTAMYSRDLMSSLNAARLDGLNAIGTNVETVLGQINAASYMLAADAQFSRALTNAAILNYSPDSTEPDEQVAYYHAAQTVIGCVRGMSTLYPVYAIGVYFHEGQVRYFNGMMMERLYDTTYVEQIVQQVRLHPDRIIYTDVFGLRHKSVVGVVRTLRNPRTLESYAELVVLVEPDKLAGCLSVGGSVREGLFIINGSGEVIVPFGADPDDPARALWADCEFAGPAGVVSAGGRSRTDILYRRIEGTDWVLLQLQDPRQLTREVWRNALIQPAVALVCAVGALLFIGATARRISRPMDRLMGDMQRVVDGDMAQIDTDGTIAEVDAVGGAMNQMIDKLRQAMQIIYQKDIRQTQAELYSLQAQINPHFFYNTLEVINMTLLVRGQYDLSELVNDLADIMRFHISKQEIVIALGEEMDLIRKYMDIMAFRFGERLRWSADCTPEALSCRIVKLLAQPLVENAVRHGVEQADHPCFIAVRARCEGEMLILEVEDDGGGIDPGVAEAINRGTYRGPHDRHSGVGLNNIIQRIHLYYGEAYGLEIAPREGGGTLARMRLPRQIEDDGEGNA